MTHPPTCTTCGAPRKWSPDSNRKSGGVWRRTCEHDARGGNPGASSQGPRRRKAGNKRWLLDGSLPVCPREGCSFDRGSCHHQ